MVVGKETWKPCTVEVYGKNDREDVSLAEGIGTQGGCWSTEYETNGEQEEFKQQPRRREKSI